MIRIGVWGEEPGARTSSGAVCVARAFIPTTASAFRDGAEIYRCGLDSGENGEGELGATQKIIFASDLLVRYRILFLYSPSTSRLTNGLPNLATTQIRGASGKGADEKKRPMASRWFPPRLQKCLRWCSRSLMAGAVESGPASPRSSKR